MDSQQDQTNLFKQKRDEYLVEIRKKKISDQLQAKRLKIALASDQSQDNDTVNQPQASLQDLTSSFITLYKAGTLDGLYDIAKNIRKAVCDNNPPIDELINSGIMPYIMDLLKTDINQSIELVIECLWTAANVASQDSESVEYLVGLDIIPIAFQLLEHQNPDVIENVIWILANLAGDSKTYKDAMLKEGISSKIVVLLGDHSQAQHVINSTVWLMSNLCRKPYPKFEEVASFLFFIEYFLKNSKDEELVEHCMSVLWVFTDTEDKKQIQKVIDTDLYSELFGMIKGGNSKIRGYAIKTIGNIVCNAKKHTKDLVGRGLIELLLPVLDDPANLTRKNVCWTYSNILASGPSQVSKVFEFESGKIVKKLFEMALAEDKEIAKECVYALANSCGAGRAQEIDFLVREGFIEMIVEIFTNGNDMELIQRCLKALNRIIPEGASLAEIPEENPYYIRLQQCDGINGLEKLQTYADKDMFELIERILDDCSGKAIYVKNGVLCLRNPRIPKFRI